MARRFTNLDPAHRPQSFGAVLKWGIVDRLSGARRKAPAGPPAPRVPPDLAAIHDPDPAPRVTWIGHSSFLVTVDGRHVLIDPVFRGRLAGLYRRHLPPGLTPGELPPLAAALVSHNHYDHLDAATLRLLPRELPVVAPLGLGRWLRRRGSPRAAELSWWESVGVDGLCITLVPARHWSRRHLADVNRSWWGGFVIAGRTGAVYHAGDSAFFAGFSEIGRRFPDLLAALLPVGGYAPGWFMESAHMTPEQALDAFLAVGARTMIPMHWGTYQLTDEPLSAPVERLRACWDERGPRDGRALRVLAVGETAALGDSREGESTKRRQPAIG